MQSLSYILSRGRLSLGMLFVVIAVGSLLHTTSTSTYAKSLDTLPVQNCAHVQSFEQCNHQDPIQQGCSADAQTVKAVPIELPPGTRVGRLELRHSNACNSYWGRTWSFGKGNAELSLSSSTFNENVPDSPGSLLTGGANLVYSDMVYGSQPPILTGFVVFSAVSAAQAHIN